jgi:hypothetical protein
MSKVSPDSYIVVYGWMVQDLRLKGNELLIYAAIHSFSSGNLKAFTGSQSYLAELIGTSRQRVGEHLKSLISKGYVAKTEQGYVSQNMTPSVIKCDIKCHEKAHNNKDINLYNNSSLQQPAVDNGGEQKKEEKPKRQQPTFEQASKPYKSAKYLANEIHTRYPTRPETDERTLQSWAREFDRLNRLDKQDWETIAEVLQFSQEDQFWRANILSGKKFREKFFTLLARMEASN